MTRSIPTPLFSTLVVGAAWRRLFLEWHLPSLWLADIDVLGASPRFRVYTSRADAGPLFEGIKAFEGLAQFDIVAVDADGYLHLTGRAGNVPSATGARGPRVLGSLTPANSVELKS